MSAADILREAADAMGYDDFERAIADWLKSVACDIDKRDNPQRVGGRFEALRIPDEHAAIKAARAYLGRDA